jgi:SSS family solute:Na+ symporter
VWFYLFRDSDFGKNGDYAISIAGYSFQPVVASFTASLVAIVGVSLVTPPPPLETLAKFFPDV